MRLPFLFLLLFPLLGFAQRPFNFGKTKERYFLSREDMRKLAISQIYTISEELGRGGMHQEWSLSILDFSDSSEITDGWFVYTGLKNPPLDTLIANAQFVNEAFWNFENGKLTAAGTGGYGTHCYTEFDADEETRKPKPVTGNMREAQYYCKFQRGEKKRRLYYHNNGLVNYVVYFAEVIDTSEHTLEQVPALPEPASDTLFFVYNSKGQILGSKTSRNQPDYRPIFQTTLDPSLSGGYPTNRIFVGKTPFEKFVDQTIGFRPKMLLFEIYPHAVIPFVYDVNLKHYFQRSTLELEAGEWTF